MKFRYLPLILLSAGMMRHAAIGAQPNKKSAARPAIGVTLLPENIFELSEVPENYRKGVSQGAVLKQFNAVADLTKNEFEKSHDFHARQRTALAASPLAPDRGPLGFVVNSELVGIEFAYNADADQYQAKQSHSFSGFCRYPRPFSLPKDATSLQLCVVGILDHKETTYSGQNLFGVSAKVHQERGTYLSVSVPSTHRFLQKYRDNLYAYNDAIDFPSRQARKYKTADLKMMLVGRIDGTNVIDGEGKIMQPKIDSPYDVLIENAGIPFKLEAVIYFFQSDGKILAMRDFRAQD